MRPVNYNSLSWQERREVRAEYVRHQGGNCYHCGAPLCSSPSKKVVETRINKRLFPAAFFDHAVHLHHDHATGMTIGAVHAKCNAVLWQYHRK